MVPNSSNILVSVDRPEVTAKALSLVLKERSRQRSEEGYTAAHDDQHILAAAYALEAGPLQEKANKLLRNAQASIIEFLEKSWEQEEFDENFFKPKDPIHNVKVACALILAELERRLQAEEESEGCGPCSVCQTETTYSGEHNGDYPVWLCPDHGGKP